MSTIAWDSVKYEISAYEAEIRRMQAEKSHTRRWINKANRQLEPYAWELPDIAARRIESAKGSIAHNEAVINRLDEKIAMYKQEIAKLRKSQA